MRTTTVIRSTPLPVSQDQAWAHATSLAGIQAELPWPLRLVTRPTVATIDEFVEAGSVLAILRAGPVPVLRWHPGIAELGERHFVETSTDMTWMHGWRHERTVGATAARGCTLTDTVTFEPRLPGTALLVGWMFARRHRALRRLLT